MIGKVVQSHGKNYLTYSCPKIKTKECDMKDISAESLEVFVSEVLVEDLCNRKVLHKISAMMEHTKDYRAAKEKLKVLGTATRNVMRVFEYGCTAGVVEKLKALSANKEAVKKVIQDYELSAKGINKNNFDGLADKFGSILINSDDPEVKKYLSEAIDSIEAGDDEITVILKIA